MRKIIAQQSSGCLIISHRLSRYVCSRARHINYASRNMQLRALLKTITSVKRLSVDSTLSCNVRPSIASRRCSNFQLEQVFFFMTPRYIVQCMQPFGIITSNTPPEFLFCFACNIPLITIVMIYTPKLRTHAVPDAVEYLCSSRAPTRRALEARNTLVEHYSCYHTQIVIKSHST